MVDPVADPPLVRKWIQLLYPLVDLPFTLNLVFPCPGPRTTSVIHVYMRGKEKTGCESEWSIGMLNCSRDLGSNATKFNDFLYYSSLKVPYTFVPFSLAHPVSAWLKIKG